MTPENTAAVLQRKTANVCLRALTDAGVFKMTAEGMQASQRFKKVLENGKPEIIQRSRMGEINR